MLAPIMHASQLPHPIHLACCIPYCRWSIPNMVTFRPSGTDHQTSSEPRACLHAPSFCRLHGCRALQMSACRFHELRKHRPKIASKRKVNETLYAGMGVRTGWFCGAQPLRKSIAKIQVQHRLSLHHCSPVALSGLVQAACAWPDI